MWLHPQRLHEYVLQQNTSIMRGGDATAADIATLIVAAVASTTAVANSNLTSLTRLVGHYTKSSFMINENKRQSQQDTILCY